MIEDRTINQGELAEYLGITRRQIQRLTKNGILTKIDAEDLSGREVWYPFLDSVRAYIDYLRKPKGRKRPIVRRILTQAELSAMMPDMKEES